MTEEKKVLLNFGNNEKKRTLKMCEQIIILKQNLTLIDRDVTKNIDRKVFNFITTKFIPEFQGEFV